MIGSVGSVEHPDQLTPDNNNGVKALNTLSLLIMFKKKVIVSCLLPAYLLLVLHAVIPHHHHFSAEAGPLSFHHGFNAHHHEHLADDQHNDPDGHGHTAHFVHSPEFGTAMVRPDVNWSELSLVFAPFNIAPISNFSDRIILQDIECIGFPESPPLYLAPEASSFSLRGPPSYVIA